MSCYLDYTYIAPRYVFYIASHLYEIAEKVHM